jgi:hypothetical protein
MFCRKAYVTLPRADKQMCDRDVLMQPKQCDYWLRWATFVGCGTLLCQLIAYNFVDIDIWHEMALIRESVAAGHLLKADPYAYTPTVRHLIDHEWGAGAIAYWATIGLGSRAIVVLKFLAALGTGIICVRCSEARGGNFRLLGACAPLAIFLAHLGFFPAIRAQAYSFFLTAFWLLLLDGIGTRTWDRKWMIAALAIFPLWVNLHAGFVVGLCLTAVHALEQLLRKNPLQHLLLLLIGMSIETVFNPYGFGYFSYLKRALLMARPYAPEWSPVWSLGNAWTVGFIAAVLVAVYSVWSTGWRGSPGILVLAATAVEAGIHRKLLPLFAIAWLCYVPGYFQEAVLGKWWIEFARRRGRFLSAAWIVITCVCLAAAIRQKPWNLAVPQPLYPVGPVQYLAQEKFAGNLMVPLRQGAYVSWKLYPAVKVSLDSRYEVAYSDAIVKQIFDFYEGRPDWRSTLREFPTNAVLIPTDAPILRLMQSTDWRPVYTDQQFQIYARPDSRLPAQDWSSTSFQGVFP